MNAVLDVLIDANHHHISTIISVFEIFTHSRDVGSKQLLQITTKCNSEQLMQCTQLTQQTNKRDKQQNNAVEVARTFDNVYGQKSLCKFMYSSFHAPTHSEHTLSILCAHTQRTLKKPLRETTSENTRENIRENTRDDTIENTRKNTR